MVVYTELTEIAKELGVAKSTLRNWTLRYKQLEELVVKQRIRNYWVVCVIQPEEFKRRYCEIVDNIKYRRVRDNLLRKYNNGLNWTRSAIMCYENNGDCTKCMNWEIACHSAELVNGKPPMIRTVQKILDVWGEPPKQNNMESDDENNV